MEFESELKYREIHVVNREKNISYQVASQETCICQSRLNPAVSPQWSFPSLLPPELHKTSVNTSNTVYASTIDCFKVTNFLNGMHTIPYFCAEDTSHMAGLSCMVT